MLAILRNEWRAVGSTVLALLVLWSTAAGLALVRGAARAAEQAAAALALARADEERLEVYRRRAAAIEAFREGRETDGVKLHDGELDWGPTRLLYLAAWVPARAALPPSPLAAAGDDVHARATAYERRLWTGELVPVAEPIASPLTGSLGSPRLPFLVIWLLPLIVLGASFDTMSRERDGGTLPLLLAQGVVPWRLRLAKLGLPVLVLFSACVVTGVLTGLLASAPAPLVAALASSTFLYGIAWLALAATLDGRCSSTTNAGTLGAIFVVLVVAVPTIGQAVAEAAHPVPPRAIWAEEHRALADAREHEFDRLPDDARRLLAERFLERHPAYRPPAAADPYYSEYVLWRVAHEDAGRAARAAIEERFDGALRRQELLAESLAFLSPAALLQRAMLEISGTGRSRHDAFLAQAERHRAAYETFLWPRTFAGSVISSREYARIPRFEWQEPPPGEVLRQATPALAGLSVWALSLGLLAAWSAARGWSPRTRR